MALGLALFNLAFRLGSEFVTEWDESLYGLTAWEALTRGSWLGTTFLGQLDYYNTKPPLLVWLIAGSFKVFGASLVSLRLPSVISAWLTVAIVQGWTRRHFGSLAALLSSLILATMFGFVYVHSGRSAATDAMFTLLVVLTVVVASAQIQHPGRAIWFGPVLAAAFLLRGMAVLLPLAIALLALAYRLRKDRGLTPYVFALLLFVVPSGTWAIARYRLDGWNFLGPMVMYDLVARTLHPIEDHPGRWFYYLKVLQAHHYDWLFAGAIAWLVTPHWWTKLRSRFAVRAAPTWTAALLAFWAGLCLAVPTVMQTKVPWYLNAFYPVCAIGIGLICTHALNAAASGTSRWRFHVILATLVIASAVSETKLVWYSFARRDLALSTQSLILAERDRLRGRRLYLEPQSRASHFVAEAIVKADVRHVVDRREFPRRTEPGDYVLTLSPCNVPEFRLIRSNGRRFLYQRDQAPGGSEFCDSVTQEASR